jgi:hypothetical protein
MKPTYTETTADLSPCGLFRYSLKRSWHMPGEEQSQAAFVMLNPSTADGTQDDPTIRRCVGFARSWGHTSLLVVNLYPFRCTDPAKLLTVADRLGGPKANDVIVEAARSSKLVIAAWGAWQPDSRVSEVGSLIVPHQPLFCLGTTQNGSPRHPLYVKADKQPVRFIG